MPLADAHPKATYTKKLHEKRSETPRYPDIESDPELKSAYTSLQLHWLETVPGYREALKEKLSEAAKQANKRAMKIETNQQTAYGQKLGPVLKQQEREDQLERLAGY